VNAETYVFTGIVFVARPEHADAPHAVALLRARRERPSRRASERDFVQLRTAVWTGLLVTQSHKPT
jgi:hypothetical protein